MEWKLVPTQNGNFLQQTLMKILDYSQYIEGEPFYELRPLGA